MTFVEDDPGSNPAAAEFLSFKKKGKTQTQVQDISEPKFDDRMEIRVHEDAPGENQRVVSVASAPNLIVRGVVRPSLCSVNENLAPQA
jgi:hypothetical protein